MSDADIHEVLAWADEHADGRRYSSWIEIVLDGEPSSVIAGCTGLRCSAPRVGCDREGRGDSRPRPLLGRRWRASPNNVDAVHTACHADPTNVGSANILTSDLAGSPRRTIEKDANVNPRDGEYPKATVMDPWLRAYRRRYFTQPPEGPGWRAFTAQGATRRARRGSPSVFTRLRQRWKLAIAREEQLRRQGRLSSFGPTNPRTVRS